MRPPRFILAIAAGHAVQILKRYYEEYSKVSKEQPNLSPKERNHAAVFELTVKSGAGNGACLHSGQPSDFFRSWFLNSNRFGLLVFLLAPES